MSCSSVEEQKRLLGIDLPFRDQAYLVERQKASKLKAAVAAFKEAIKLRKQGKITRKQLDTAENAALEAGADFAEIDKWRSEAVTEFDVGDKVVAVSDIQLPNGVIAKNSVGRVTWISEREVGVFVPPAIQESFDAGDWGKFAEEASGRYFISKDLSRSDRFYRILHKIHLFGGGYMSAQHAKKTWDVSKVELDHLVKTGHLEKGYSKSGEYELTDKGLAAARKPLRR